MKIFLTILFLFSCASFTLAQQSTRVRTYVKRDGTMVQSHRRTTPDRHFNNNYSTAPNINPYTGAEGTKTSRPRRTRR